MAVAVTKDMVKQAKEESKYIIQVQIDGRHLSHDQIAEFKLFSQSGSFAITGPCPEEAAKELADWATKWIKANKI